MNWRLWGISVIFLTALVASSCRDTVQPDEDRNRPPETYLTAAPLDSVGGGRLDRVPYRYHAHWSGADIDGEVVGFFVAVTETIPIDVSSGQVPHLPPPRPQAYEFTTKTDSIFTFSVHEGFGTDREHGLFVYAVDNEGKVDPDPAFVNFVARNRNLPGLNFTEARAEGSHFEQLADGSLIEVPFTRQLTDNVNPVGSTTQPRDTIPVGSAVYFAWQGFDRDWQSRIAGYKYKLFEPNFVIVDSTVKSVEYATGVGNATIPIPIDNNVFRIRSIDEAGGSTLDDSLRRFQVNFDSDTWWSGPDPNDPSIAPALLTDERGVYLLGGVQGATPPELDRWIGEDEPYEHLPSERPPMNTIIEETRRGTEVRFYIRADGDTIARNATAIYAQAGGFDKDSPYSVIVPEGGTGTGRVGVPGPANGSPIAHEFRVFSRLRDALGRESRNNPSFSALFPDFNPLGFGFNPEVTYLYQVANTGEQWAQVRSVDGNDGKDRRIRDALSYGEDFEDGTLPPTQSPAWRPLVFKFITNYNPYFQVDHPFFEPKPGQVISESAFQSRLFMFDPDSTSAQGIRAPFLVRVRFLVPGEPVPPRSQGWQPENGFRMTSGENFPISIPGDLPSGPVTFQFELSDLPSNDPFDRRVILAEIPFVWQP